MLRRWFILAAGLLWTSSSFPQSVDYPNRPLKLVLPFAAGGGTDVIARLLAQQVSVQMGVPVLIENRPGANSNVGAEAVAKAAPDGYTLLFCTISMVMNKFVYPKLGYDYATDLTPVLLTSKLPLVLVTNKSVPARTLPDFVAYAKANPGKLSYASSGTGGVTHMASLLFQKAVGIEAVHVPYRGGGPALNDLLVGSVQFYIDGANAAIPFIKDDRLTGLAVTSAERLADISEVPTIAETVSPGFDVVAWQGVMAPAGTPQPIVNRLGDEFRKALANPDVRAKLMVQSTVPVGSTQDEYRAFLAKEAQTWQRVIAETGVKLD